MAQALFHNERPARTQTLRGSRASLAEVVQELLAAWSQQNDDRCNMKRTALSTASLMHAEADDCNGGYVCGCRDTVRLLWSRGCCGLRLLWWCLPCSALPNSTARGPQALTDAPVRAASACRPPRPCARGALIVAALLDVGEPRNTERCEIAPETDVSGRFKPLI